MGRAQLSGAAKLDTLKVSPRQEHDMSGPIIAILVFCVLAYALWNASQKDALVQRFNNRGKPTIVPAERTL